MDTLLFGIKMDLDNYKDMEREGFLFEIQKIALEIEQLIDKYNVRDDVMSLMIIGLIDELEDSNQLYLMKTLWQKASWLSPIFYAFC